MKKYFNQGVYKKTYLLEFKLNGMTSDAVAFSVPPQSEEFDFPQRIGETKTFGGSVFEDYGNDTTKITLTGSTVNSELRIVYKGTMGQTILDGNGEIFYIKKLIEKYGKVDKLKAKKVYLYSLTDSENKWWQVVINDFQVKRNKDNPFTYTYTLQCTSVPPINTLSLKNYTPNWLESFVSNVHTLCGSITEATEALSTGLNYFRSGLDLLTSVKNCVNEVMNSVDSFYSVLSGYITSTAEYITETLALGETIINSGKRLAYGENIKLYNTGKELVEAVNKVRKYIDNFSENDISTNLQGIYDADASEIKDGWKKIAENGINAANSIFANIKHEVNSVGYTVIPGENNTDDQIVVYYGFIQKTVKESDSWDSIAREYYGDPSLGSIIALFNGSQSNTSDLLVVGSKITIPIISQTDAVNTENQIYPTPNSIDNYGKDILIGTSGDFGVNQGDFAISKGITNLEQAIDNRLQTSIDNRIRLTLYGIRTSIGSSSEMQSYLISSISETLQNEPRIKSVEKISYKGVGDNVAITVDYIDINDESQTFGGTY